MARSSDVAELCILLNEIILTGGTTALEYPLSHTEFRDCFLQGENYLCCYVAVDDRGHIAGFQSMERHPELPNNWADIGTFARLKPKIKGVGTALFSKTKYQAKQLGIIAINATIRVHNKGGLIYYDKMGFETYLARDGNETETNQISKQFFIE
jgi:L-amino acid N-acyltransferase YncA